MPTKGKTTAKRSTSKATPARSSAKKAPAKRRAASRNDLDRRWSILLFALGALFVVLSFIPGQSGWLWLRTNVLFGGLGISGWLLGPMLIWWAILISLGRPVFPAVIKGVLFMVALSGTALVFSKAQFAELKFSEVMALLLESGKPGYGGGLLALPFGYSMLAFMGRPAANIVLVVLMLIALMVLTGVTPGDIARFFGRLWEGLPRREKQEEYYEDVYEEAHSPKPAPAARKGRKKKNRGGAVAYPPLMGGAGAEAAVSSARNGSASRQMNLFDYDSASRRWGKRGPDVDVDLGPDDLSSTPGLAEHDEVVLGPGGTFGMNPLEEEKARQLLLTNRNGNLFEEDEGEITPFDPHSLQSLIEEASVSPPLLFGEDDPYAHLGGADSKLPDGSLFDVEYMPPPGGPEFDLFGRSTPSTPAPATPAEPATDLPPWELVGESALTPPIPDAAVAAAQTSGSAPAVAAAFRNPFSGELPEDAPSTDPSVDAMIEAAAAIKDDTPKAIPNGQGVAGSLNQAAPLFNEPYHTPPLSLFKPAPASNDAGAREEMRRTADLLVSTLASFGVQTRILDVSRGPSVTRYEVQPQAGVKISRITGLADDIALNLAAAGVRIEAPIPGKPAVGIEVPNKIKSTVSIRSILESGTFAEATSPLSVALGKDIAGEVVVADLTKMPHLLIAGSTGSGKSVCVNATIMSFLYKSTPEDIRLLLIDPKVVELAEYNGIPHLLMPVVTEPRKAAGALGSAVAEMERRYHLFAENNVRDIKTFNKRAERYGDLEKLPHIAIIIDELADLMMTSGKEVEDYICRIAQKARAAGMHLIVATQRPSVDVITGLIKANIPSRIAFAVSSQVDSRTILDGGGAEKLLGMGDMLFMPVGANKPVRVQGTYVQDKEISSVLTYIKQQCDAQYDEGMIEEMERRSTPEATESDGEGGEDMLHDPTFISAVETAMENGQISTSFLQRRLRLGYARAGRLMDEMERLHIISPPDGSKPRQVLISRQQWLEMSMNGTPDPAE